MPVLRNDASQGKAYKDKSGKAQILPPGEEVETYFFAKGLTVVSMEPLFKATMDVSKVSSSDADPWVDVDEDCDYVLVEQIEGQINVMAEADTSGNRVTLLEDRTNEHAIRPLPCYGTFNRLVVTGSGSCVITQCRYIPGARR